MPNHFLICDVEATSARPLNAQLLTGHFLLCDSDLDIIDSYSLLARPRVWDKEADEAEAMHGISYAEALHFPEFNKAMLDLKLWLDKLPECHFVAHANRTIFGSFSTYDYAVLTSNLFYTNAHYSLYRACPRRLIISTHSLAKYVGLNCSLDLKSLTQYLGIALDNHHDSRADTVACYEVFKRLINRVDIKEFLERENYKLEVENDERESGTTIHKNSKQPSKKSSRVQRANKADLFSIG